MLRCRILLTCPLLALVLIAAAEQGQPPANDRYGDPLPAGAVARLGSVRWLHNSTVVFAAFLADGKSVVTVSEDLTLRVSEFPSGKEIRRIDLPAPDKRFRGGPIAAALANDGRTIATCCFSPIVGQGGGTEIHLHDIETGKELSQLKTTAANAFGFAFGLAFSPSGEDLALLDNAGIILIFDRAKAKQVRSFGGADGPVNPNGVLMVYAPDGKSLATIGGLQNNNGDVVVRLWNPATGNEIRTIRTDNKPIGRASVAFSPTGKTLAFTTGEAVTLVEVATGKTIGTLGEKAMSTRALAFSKDGTKLYKSSSEGGLTEWDVATCKLLRDCSAATYSLKISPSPDGNTLILYGNEPGPQFVDLAGQEMAVVTAPAAPLVSLQFTPDGKYVLTQREPWGLVRKWDAQSGKDLGVVSSAFLQTLSGFGRAASPDGKVVAVEASPPQGAQQIFIVDVVNGKELGHIASGGSPMRFSPDGKTLAIGRLYDGKIELYDVSAFKLQHTLRFGEAPFQPMRALQLCFSTDGKRLASLSAMSTVDLWDTNTGRHVGALSRAGGEAISGCAFSADGRCLVLHMDDGTAVLYELATGQPRRIFGKKGAVLKNGFQNGFPASFLRDTAIAYAPDGRTLVQSGPDGVLHVWDILAGQELAAFKGHTKGVNAVAFAPDGKTVASASDDSTALIWDVASIARPAAAAKTLQPGDLETCWEALAGNDAAKAFAALGDLVAAPQDAVAWIKDRVKPSAPLDMKRVQELLLQLDANQYKVRAVATSELLKLGEQLLPVFDKVLAANPSLETKLRLEDLRTKLSGLVQQGDRLRAYRAVEVLEFIGSPEARQVLQALADGAPGTLLTSSAQAALKR